MKNQKNNHPILRPVLNTLFILFLGVLALSAAPNLFGQGLNWEGQTGAFITPFAYMSQSDKDKVGKPQVAFHYLNGGEVLGNHFQASITVGMFSRAEFGYTRSIVSEGSSTALSPLFKNGFNIFHGKVNVLPENYNKNKAVPAISIGFVARTQVKRVAGVLNNQSTNNGDIYVVGTKTITSIKKFPILINLGYKATNASVFGIAGNSPKWEGRAFGAVAGVISAGKGAVIVGSEFAQQPKRVVGLPTATIPTSMTYFVRIVPKGDVPFNIDFGIAQAVGKIQPGVDLKARHQFAMGMSYRF